MDSIIKILAGFKQVRQTLPNFFLADTRGNFKNPTRLSSYLLLIDIAICISTKF
jgi:hypothetical protein